MLSSLPTLIRPTLGVSLSEQQPPLWVVLEAPTYPLLPIYQLAKIDEAQLICQQNIGISTHKSAEWILQLRQQNQGLL